MKLIPHLRFREDDHEEPSLFSFLDEAKLMPLRHEYNRRVNEAMQFHNLKKVGIHVPFEIVRAFLQVEGNLTDEEMRYLESLSLAAPDAPAKLLQRVISGEVTRECMRGVSEEGEPYSSE